MGWRLFWKKMTGLHNSLEEKNDRAGTSLEEKDDATKPFFEGKIILLRNHFVNPPPFLIQTQPPKLISMIRTKTQNNN